MTPEQLAEERKKYGLPEQGLGQVQSSKSRLEAFDQAISVVPSVKPPMPGGGGVRKGISYAANIVKEGAKKITGDIKQQGERIAESPNTEMGNFIEKPALVGQTVGKVTKDALVTLYTPVGDAIGAIADRLSELEPVKQAAATKAAGTILNTVGNLSMSIEELKKKHPDLAEAAEELFVIGGQALGTKPAISATSKTATAVAKTAAKGVEKTAEVAAKAADAVKPAPWRSQYKAQTAKEFAEEGIVAPISAVTESPFLKAVEAMSAKGIFGKKVMEQIEKARETVDTKIAKTAEAATPVKAMSDEVLGKTMATDLRASVTSFKDKQDKVYTAFAQKYGSVQERPFNTVDELQAILADQGQDFFRGADPRLQKMFDRLSGEDNVTVREMRKEGIPESIIESEKTNFAPEMSIDEMRATRTSLGEAIAKDPENAAYKRLYGALSEDLKAALGVHDADGAKVMQKLDADYAAGITKLEGRIAQSIEQANPENIVHKLMTRDSADAINVLKGLVKPETFAEYRKFFLRDTLEKSVVREKFSVERLKSNLADYDDATLNALLDAETRDMLDATIARLERLEKLSESLKPTEKILGGSQTAFLQQATAPGTAIGTLTLAIFTGQFHIAALILGGITGKYGVSKLFTSEAGRKFLTEGFKATPAK